MSNDAPDSVDTLTSSTWVEIESIDVNEAGTYSIELQVSLLDYPSVTSNFIYNVELIDPCLQAIYSRDPITTPIYYNLRYPAVITPVSPMSSSELDSLCGSFNYLTVDTDGNTLNDGKITVDFSTM